MSKSIDFGIGLGSLTVESVEPLDDGTGRIRVQPNGIIMPAGTVVLDTPGARFTDPSTSHLAAGENQTRAQTHREIAYRQHQLHPRGLTDHELAALTGIGQDSIGKRRGELVARGLIMETSERRTTPRGSAAIVWRIV